MSWIGLLCLQIEFLRVRCIIHQFPNKLMINASNILKITQVCLLSYNRKNLQEHNPNKTTTKPIPQDCNGLATRTIITPIPQDCNYNNKSTTFHSNQFRLTQWHYQATMKNNTKSTNWVIISLLNQSIIHPSKLILLNQ